MANLTSPVLISCSLFPVSFDSIHTRHYVVPSPISCEECHTDCFLSSHPIQSYWNPRRMGADQILVRLNSGGGLKTGFSIRGWNWSTEHLQNETYLAMTYQFLAHSSVIGSMTAKQNLESILFNITVNAHSYMITLERGIIVNGNPMLYGREHAGFNAVYLPTPGYIGTEFVQGFCSSPDYPFPKFQSIEYDPSIVALFDPPQYSTDNGAPSTSPSHSKNRKTWVVAVAVSIPLVFVIVATTVLLVIFVPAVKHFFRPYSKRSMGEGKDRIESNTLKSSPSSDGWTKASKPQ